MYIYASIFLHLFRISYYIKRMCLGTFSRRARSLATIYIFARVRIIGTLVPFLCNRIRVSKDTLTFIDFCLYLENLTRIDFRIGYLENLQNASLVFFILIMLSLFWQHNEPSYFHNPIAF